MFPQLTKVFGLANGSRHRDKRNRGENNGEQRLSVETLEPRQMLAATVVSQAIASQEPAFAAATAVSPADFDADGDVDGTDLAQWQSDYGPGGNADADGDGASSGLDFLAWQRQYTGSLNETAAAVGTTLFSDNFSTDTTGGYMPVVTEGNDTSHTVAFLYDGAGQRAQVSSEDNGKVLFSQTGLTSTDSGTFSIDFNPTEKYPFGGNLWVRLMQDANNYYEIENTDGYGAGEIRKFVGGNTTPVETASFTAEYSQGNNYTISIDFSPTNTTVTAFGDVLTLNTNTASINVDSFEVEASQQTAYFDNISLEEAAPVLFSDNFSTNTIDPPNDNYTESASIAPNGNPRALATFVYDDTGDRAQVVSEDNLGIVFSQNVTATESGKFSIDFDPTKKFPLGGVLKIRLLQDANNYYEIENTDGYGAGEIRKFVGGNTTPVETVPFAAEYTQNTNGQNPPYTIEIDFSPTETTVNAFGETRMFNTDTTAINVDSFEVDVFQQTAFFDNIELTGSGSTFGGTSPVEDWVTIAGDTLYNNNSAGTNSPEADDADGDTIAANFSPVTLANDGDFIELTGSVTFDTAMRGDQFRWGLYDGDDSLTVIGQDSPAWNGYFAFAPRITSPFAGRLFSHVGAAGTNPASVAASTQLGTDAISGTNTYGNSTVPGNIPLNFSLRVEKTGSNTADVTGHIDNGDPNVLSVTGTESVSGATLSTLSFDSAAFFMGSQFGDGNDATFSNIEVTTGSGASGDTQAPTVPTGLSATPVSSSQIDLSWTASTDNVGVDGYKIYRDGVELPQNPTNTTYQDVGLTPLTNYSYTVAAYDIAGNLSAQSAPATATTQAATGNTYYISPTGSDTTGDGTEANPWGSLKKAHDNLSPGDTVLVRGGDYYNNQSQDMSYINSSGNRVTAAWTASGTPGNPITIAAYPGETPTFHRNSGGQHFLSFRAPDSLPEGVGIQYVTVDGLTVDGYQNAFAMRGCRTFVNNTTWSYDDCADAVDGNGNPIPANFRHIDNIIIRNNHIINTFEHSIYPGAQVRNLEIYNNRIENPGHHGIHLFHETGVIGGEIYNNIVSGGKVGIGVYTEADGVNVYNNTIYNQTSSGFRFGDVVDVVVANNIVVETKLGVPAIRSTTVLGEIADFTFKNNIYYNTAGNSVANWNNTAYRTLGDWLDVTVINGIQHDTNSLADNPQLVNVANGDFHLISNSTIISPAIDAGIATNSPSTDFEGNMRPVDGDGVGGAQYDIGAYEYVPGSSLRAEQGEVAEGHATPINTTALAPIVEEATRRWETAGFDTAVLDDVDVSVGSLGGAQLATRSGNNITIDVDAAGYGWFVDRTPGRDNEYVSGEATRGVASRRMDLLTAVSHELGHVLGLPHDAAGATPTVMHDSLDVGQRRTAHEEPGKVSQTAKGELFDAALATFGGRDGLPTGRQHSAPARFVPEALDVLAQGFALDRRRQRDLPVGRFSRDNEHDFGQTERDQEEVLDDLFADFEEVLASQL